MAHVFRKAFKPSEFAIINTDGNSDFDIENRITLRDALDRKLDLRLHYMYVICSPRDKCPHKNGQSISGIGRFFQSSDIQSVFSHQQDWTALLCQTSTRANRIGSPQDVAGETRPGKLL